MTSQPLLSSTTTTYERQSSQQLAAVGARLLFLLCRRIETVNSSPARDLFRVFEVSTSASPLGPSVRPNYTASMRLNKESRMKGGEYDNKLITLFVRANYDT